MDGAVKTDLMNWRCFCGTSLKASVEDVSRGTAKCPVCGASVSLDQQEAEGLTDADETQMVSLQDMAQMAQDGVKLDVSGEWDTSTSPLDPTRKKKD
jgi:hypothetical protein